MTDQDAAARRARVGPNLLRRQKPRHLLDLLLQQVRSVIVWLLAAAAVLSLLLGDTAEAAAIATVLLINGAIGFTTELRAVRSMEALLHMADPQTRVRRSGEALMVDATDLVPGDVVLLEAGDVVTADLRLVEASNLHISEAALTGESIPVRKSVAPVAAEAPLGDRTCMSYKGTAVTQGAGTAIVVATGMETELGRISHLVEEADAGTSPLERQLDRLGHRLLGVTLVLASAAVVAGMARGEPVVLMIETGVALAVAAIPEGLPVVATLCLARGMSRMARRKALIRRLSAVETLGATTLILTDKTGTLTENRMTVTRYLLKGGDVDLSNGPPLDMSETLRCAIRIGALCTSAGGDTGRGAAGGDPMDTALLAVARENELAPGHATRRARVAHHAFDPEWRMMAMLYREGDGVLVAVKGAPEAVLSVCDNVMGENEIEALDAEARETWASRASEAASQGARLLGLAMKRAETASSDPYSGLTLIGLACLSDPLRAEIPAAIGACRDAGIRVVMVTGDHAGTAARIARDAGLVSGEASVIEGRDLTDLATRDLTAELGAKRKTVDVFARIAPATKLALVAGYQRDGEIVAMTGDGVNDAPALKQADIGVAMGLRGTQVAREAAQMVLQDDSFATIVAAIAQGRVIFDNIRRFVVYLLSCNLSELLVVGLAVGAGLPSPLLPLQILFLNLVTDVFPAFALGLGEGKSDVMRRPPRNPKEEILSRAQWIRIAVLGLALTVATLSAYWAALALPGIALREAMTIAFVALSLGQLWIVFAAGWDGTRVFAPDIPRNRAVWGAIGLCLGLVGAALWLPGPATILKLSAPSVAGLGIALAASVAPLCIALAGRSVLQLVPRYASQERRSR